MSPDRTYQLWRPRCDDLHSSNQSSLPPGEWEESDGDHGNATADDSHRHRRKLLRAQEESEFRRIRLTKRADEILTDPRHSVGREDQQGDVPFEPLVVVPPPLSLEGTIDSCLVVGQELSLTALLLAVHRDIVNEAEIGEDFHRGISSSYLIGGEINRHSLSMICVLTAVIIMLYYGAASGIGIDSGGSRRKKAIVRLSDAVLLACILRFLSAAIRTLTASYSTDTVHFLAATGMAVHLLACDYGYANGRIRDGRGGGGGEESNGHDPQSTDPDPRPAFLGGTVSLNAALFSTTLLASRIPSNATSYAFVTWVVTLFAFYPAARHRIALKHPNRLRGSPCSMIFLALSLAVLLVITEFERVVFLVLQFLIMMASPTMQWWLQRYKQIITGPWDIAHVIKIEDTAAGTSAGDRSKKTA